MVSDRVFTPEERRQQGRLLRKQTPRASHGEWSPPSDRADPVDLLASQAAQRVAELVPYRYQRMAESPFTFYRGSAIIMANDLASTPNTGLQVQLCGDAHLSNFGLFGSPERELVFDTNDFDETLPGPWEWDLKRLAASFVIAARDNEFDRGTARELAQAVVSSYVTNIAIYSSMPLIDAWYRHISLDDIRDFIAQEIRVTEKQSRRLSRQQQRTIAAAQRRDSHGALSKLTEKKNGTYRFKSDPPFIVPLSDLASEHDPDRVREVLLEVYERSMATLPGARQFLLRRYRVVDIAHKVVGIGSVGTRCYVILLEGRDAQDPLIMQAKEALPSVLANYLEPSTYPNHGQRVVEGQRLMQAVGDIFLGWTDDRRGHDYYFRQLRDMKLSVAIEELEPLGLRLYAKLCGNVLAKAHARTGDSATIAGYVGSGNVFVEAIADFAEAYADGNERDYATFMAAIASGRIQTPDGSQVQANQMRVV